MTIYGNKGIHSYALLIFILYAMLDVNVSAEQWDKDLSDFNSYKHEYDPAREYKKFNNEKKEFKKYLSELNRAFSEYKREVNNVWGKNNAVYPSAENYIEYENDWKTRTVVDYRTGKVRIEFAFPADSHVNISILKKRVAQKLSDLVSAPPDERSIIELAGSSKPKSRKTGDDVPPLQHQLKNTQGREVTKFNVEEYSQDVTRHGLQEEKIAGADGRPRIVYSATIPMIPNHIEERASKYYALAKSQAQRMKLPTELILAVIETESYFNPLARSSVPAFGLMQLVPNSGARDAYLHLYKQERVVTDTYLYNARNNVELGAAYLSKIYFTYMEGIKDQTSRLYCTIAAYNTGPGNVFAAFGGSYSRRRDGEWGKWVARILVKINRMDSKMVYRQLRKGLPHPETREYLKNVAGRMPKYSQI